MYTLNFCTKIINWILRLQLFKIDKYEVKALLIYFWNCLNIFQFVFTAKKSVFNEKFHSVLHVSLMDIWSLIFLLAFQIQRKCK